MTIHRVTNSLTERLHIIRLSEYRFAESPCGETAFRIFLDKKYNFRHRYRSGFQKPPYGGFGGLPLGLFSAS